MDPIVHYEKELVAHEGELEHLRVEAVVATGVDVLDLMCVACALE